MGMMDHPIFEPGFLIPQEHQTARMSMDGVLQKSAVLIAVCSVFAFLTISFFLNGDIGTGTVLTMGGMVVGLILGMVISFANSNNPMLITAYAAAEGAFLGGITFMFESAYAGIAFYAVMLTLFIFFGMLALYKANLVRYNEKAMSIAYAGLFAVFGLYLASFMLSFVGIQIPYIHSSGPIGILFSLLVIGIASYMLIGDFHFIAQGTGRLPKEMEWRAAFGLMVTLVWIYIEVLRLLAKLNRR